MKKREGRRDLGKERRWRELVAGQRASGLSIRAFCAAEGVSENSFYAWRRELALRAAEAAALPGGQRQSPANAAKRHSRANAARPNQRGAGEPSKRASKRAAKSAAFVPVRLSALSESAVEIVLPSGVTLRVAAGCEEQALRTVLSALEASSC